MNNTTQRYIFSDYAAIKNVKVRKIEKVCDRLFIFIKKDENDIPFDFVEKIQRLGRKVKWVKLMESPSKEIMNYHVCFWLGKLHQKVNKDIEFAILSDDQNFDPLVAFVNAVGTRSVIRVRSSNEEDAYNEDRDDINGNVSVKEPLELLKTSNGYEKGAHRSSELVAEIENTVVATQAKKVSVMTQGNSFIEGLAGASSNLTEADMKLIDETAVETVERLLRSGNRPAMVSTLKNYILLHNHELSEDNKIEKVISKLEANKSIDVIGGQVTYHF